MDPDKTLVDWAERDLQCFGAVSREEAAVALEMWSPMRKLRERSVDAAAEVTALVLARFPKAEPPNVPGRDWLAEAKADAAVLVAEAVAVLKCAVRQGSWFCQLPAGHQGDCAPEAVAVLDEPTFCTDVYVGNEGEFKCDRPAGHGDHHWHLLAEFGWPVEVTP